MLWAGIKGNSIRSLVNFHAIIITGSVKSWEGGQPLQNSFTAFPGNRVRQFTFKIWRGLIIHYSVTDCWGMALRLNAPARDCVEAIRLESWGCYETATLTDHSNRSGVPDHLH